MAVAVVVAAVALCGGPTTATAAILPQKRRTTAGFVSRAPAGRESHLPQPHRGVGGLPLRPHVVALGLPSPPPITATPTQLAAGMWRYDKELQQSSMNDDGSDLEPPGKGLFRFVFGMLKRRTVQVVGLTAVVLSAVKGGAGKKAGGGKTGILDGGAPANAPERYVRPKNPEAQQAPPSQQQKKGSGKTAAVPLPDAESPILPPKGAKVQEVVPPASPQQPEEQQPEAEVVPPAGAGGLEQAEEGKKGKGGGKEARPRWTPFRNLKSRVAEIGGAGKKDSEAALIQEDEAGKEKEEEKEEEGGRSEQADEEEEGEEEEEGDGTVPFDEREAPYLKDGEEYLDHRGSILLGHPAVSAGEKEAGGKKKKGKAQAPAIVQIPGTEGAKHGGSSSFVSSVFRNVGPAVPRVDCVKVYKGEIKFASGSGVIFTPEGYLVTNSLLVRNALELKVREEESGWVGGWVCLLPSFFFFIISSTHLPTT